MRPTPRLWRWGEYFIALSTQVAQALSGGTVMPQACMTIWPRQFVILVAEDEAPVRNVIRLLLQTDYDILTASDGSQAMALSRACPGPIDLLLADIDMPGMDGHELHRALRVYGDE